MGSRGRCGGCILWCTITKGGVSEGGGVGIQFCGAGCIMMSAGRKAWHADRRLRGALKGRAEAEGREEREAAQGKR